MREVIENKEKADTQRQAGETVYPCEEVLGSIKPVKDFAAFYSNHKTDLEIVKAYFLLEYVEATLFTPEQLNAYRMGLEAIVKFFENSEADVKSYLLQAESKNKESVG